MNTKGIITGLALAASVFAGTSVIGAPAQAAGGSPTCVSKAEWNQVKDHQWMSRAKIHKIFDFDGVRMGPLQFVDQKDSVTWTELRTYTKCGSDVKYYLLYRRHASAPEYQKTLYRMFSVVGAD